MEDDLERRLRNVDQRAQHVAAQRRHYDATAVPKPSTPGGLVSDFPQHSALGLAAATKHNHVEGGGRGGPGEAAGGIGIQAHQHSHGGPSCPKCQSMDVSLNILRANVASVEEGYLDQIDAISETLAVVEEERDELLKRSTMYHHEAELQHATSLKRGTEVSTLRRDLVRLETESETLHRQLQHAQVQLAHQTKFSIEREAFQISNEEAAARSSVSLMEQCWWEVSTATWAAQRGAEKRLVQSERQLSLRMRLESNTIGTLGRGDSSMAMVAESSTSPKMGDAPMASFIQQEFQAAGRTMVELSAIHGGGGGLGDSGVFGTEALEAELREVDLKFNQALAAELKVKKELSMARHQLSEVQSSTNMITMDLLAQCEAKARQDVLIGFLKVHSDAALQRNVGLRDMAEKQRKFSSLEAAGKDKEISTLRRMLMEAKEDAHNSKKASGKVPELESQLKEAHAKLGHLEKNAAVAHLHQVNQDSRPGRHPDTPVHGGGHQQALQPIFVQSASNSMLSIGSEEDFFTTAHAGGRQLVAPLDTSSSDEEEPSDDDSPLPRILGAAPSSLKGGPTPQEILKKKQAEFLAKKVERERKEAARNNSSGGVPSILEMPDQHNASLSTPPDSFLHTLVGPRGTGGGSGPLSGGGVGGISPVAAGRMMAMGQPFHNNAAVAQKRVVVTTSSEISTQTSLAEVDLVQQLKDLLQGSNAGNKQTSPVVLSDTASSPVILDRGDPMASFNKGGSPATSSTGIMVDSAKTNRILENLSESVQDLKIDLETVLNKISGDTGVLVDTLNDSVGCQREDHALVMADLSEVRKMMEDKKIVDEEVGAGSGNKTKATSPSLATAEDLRVVKTTLKNLLISVSHHQKKVHDSVKTVSQTLTGIQGDIHTVRQDSQDVQFGVRALDANLLKAVERQMSIERVGSTTNSSAMTKGDAAGPGAKGDATTSVKSTGASEADRASPLWPPAASGPSTTTHPSGGGAKGGKPPVELTEMGSSLKAAGGSALSPVSQTAQHVAAKHGWDSDSDDSDDDLPASARVVRQKPAPPSAAAVTSSTGAKKFNITPFDDDSD